MFGGVKLKTSKPISTISFNSDDFLKYKLDELVENHIVEFYAMIKHHPEDDEAGKKYHWHVYIEVSKIVQTVFLGDLFNEPVPDNNKPLKCLPFESSNFANWYLYALHDVDYLALKNQSRKYHYTHNDIITNDEDMLLFRVKSIDMTKISPLHGLKEAKDMGLSFKEFFMRGSIPIQQLSSYMTAWDILSENKTNRNYRKGHDNDV